MIKVTMEEVKSLVMFHQVYGKVFCNQGFKIGETDLWVWRLGSMARPEGNR